MSETTEKSTGRSVWAIVAGFLVVVSVTIATDLILHATGVYTGTKLNDRQSALATAYRTLFAIVGSYVTARLASCKPMKHAMIGAASHWHSDRHCRCDSNLEQGPGPTLVSDCADSDGISHCVDWRETLFGVRG